MVHSGARTPKDIAAYIPPYLAWGVLYCCLAQTKTMPLYENLNPEESSGPLILEKYSKVHVYQNSADKFLLEADEVYPMAGTSLQSKDKSVQISQQQQTKLTPLSFFSKGHTISPK